MKKLIILLLFVLTIIGCANSNINNFGQEKKLVKLDKVYPEWFYNPRMNKYSYAGVGVAKESAYGVYRQRQLAIERGIDEIARQLGTKVSTITERVETESNSKFSVYSVQTVDGNIVQAILQEIWIDERTKEMYAWLVVK
ncbi:MAG: hypothetical protein PWP46_126 [Fusobacteriaceae bacterium]|jgi:uncharacterized lipoprotein NlpE involved in copper resistance|nr:hypothetical protein [Fusobacteriales bacterium]MDN5303247.1 hypothetical protein [Fusobacteriaceae bacterium]